MTKRADINRASSERPTLPISRPALPPLAEYVEKLEKIWSTRMLSNFGPCARELEGIAQGYLGNPNVRAVASCDTGLMLAIAALGIPPGSECLVPSFTFNSTINAVLWNRLIPRFIDIDPVTLNIDLDDAQRRLAGTTRLIVATHVFGSPLDLDALLALGKKHKVLVVIDSAHGYGASYRGIRIGDPRLGDFQVFSLSGTKQVTSAEGGLIAASDEEKTARIEKLRAYGFQYDYISHFVGINAKMSELHAALGVLTLPRIDEAVQRRNEIASMYREKLSGLELSFQGILPGCVSAYKDFAILCGPGRDELAEYLSQFGVQSKKYFRPLHLMPAYRQFQTADDELEDTLDVASRVLCLPIYNELTDVEVSRVSEMVHEFYDRD